VEQTAPLEVGITVIDVDRMLTFYRDVLSCVETRRSEIPESLTRPLTSSADGYLAVWTCAPGGEVLKFFRPGRTPERDAARPMLADRTGIAFITFYCRDIERVVAAAEAHGATLRSDRSLMSGSIGVKLAFFDDPEGNVIELVERVAPPKA
jgi:catechol 2,3-dioxygenase-like lactoylglutathione lyase family enzyme